MSSFFDTATRAALRERVERLSPDATRRWGTMTIGQMLAHISDQLRFACGDLAPKTRPRGPLTVPLVQWLAIDVFPWPHGKLQASPQLLQTQPSDFDRDRTALLSLFERVAATDAFGSHPMFGALSRPLWGHLMARHIDYHLTQFGA